MRACVPCRLPHQWSGLRPRVCAKTHTRESRSSQGSRWRPYRVECTGSLPTSEVKRRRARLVLGWGTAREDLRVLPAFATSACVGACCGACVGVCCGVRGLRACVSSLRRAVSVCCGRARALVAGAVVGGACAPSNAAVADSLPRHKQQRLTQPSGCQTIVYTSRFVRVILAQGPC